MSDQAEKKFDIPMDVVDRQAYVQYRLLEDSKLLKNRMLENSYGEEVNLGSLPHWFRKCIEHLPPKEQEYFTERKRQFDSAMRKRNILKRKAFGSQVGRPHKKEVHINTTQKAEMAIEQDVVTLLGKMFSINEVVRILVEDNGIHINPTQVKTILARNLVAIERAREEFRNKVTDVRLYNKRPRLEELAWMYSKMKMRYIAMNSTEAYNAMLRTLEQIRKEAEGDILNINGAVDINLNVELQNHINKEILKTINLKEIILGRIAARMNYDTKKLVAGLHNSYYNQFVQISGDYNQDAEMKYPSLINYDFMEIERRNAEQDDIVDVQAEEVTEEQHDKASTIKEMFLKRIRAKKDEYEARTGTAVSEEHQYEVKEDYEEIQRHKGHKRYDKMTKQAKSDEHRRTHKKTNNKKKGE